MRSHTLSRSTLLASAAVIAGLTSHAAVAASITTDTSSSAVSTGVSGHVFSFGANNVTLTLQSGANISSSHASKATVVSSNVSGSTLSNAGTIAAAGVGNVAVEGVKTITNTGTITGSASAAAILSAASSSLTNSGTITSTSSAAIIASGANATIINQSGGTISGTANADAILVTGDDATITNQSGGTITSVNDAIVIGTGVSGAEITNAGTISSTASGSSAIASMGEVAITNSSGGTISGVSSAIMFASGSDGSSLTNAGTVTTAGDNAATVEIASGVSGIEIDNNSGGVISASGANATAIMARGAADITNAGTISTSGSGGTAIEVGSNVSGATISNESGGTISASGSNSTAIRARSAVNITNAGIITANGTAIDIATGVSGSTITNSGTISATGGTSAVGINARGTTTITNTGTITSTGDAIVVGQSAAGTTITNTGGTIRSTGGSGNAAILVNANTSITNQSSGIIEARNAADAIHVSSNVSASSTTISNSSGSTIRATGTGAAIKVDSAITSITNAGTISSTSGTAIEIGSAGRVSGGITNTSTGTISGGGGTAIDNSASNYALTINNAGTIVGDILFGSAADILNITGGTLTGDVVGQNGNDTVNISATSFTTGGELQDVSDVNVTGGTTTLSHAVTGADTFDISNGATVNMGANVEADTFTNAGTLSVTNSRTITGDYTQSADGTLTINEVGDSDRGRLTVSGEATLADGSNIVANVSSSSTGIADGDSFTALTAGTLDATAAELDVTDNNAFVNFEASIANDVLSLVASLPSAAEAAAELLSNAGFASTTALSNAAGGGSEGTNVVNTLNAYSSLMTALQAAGSSEFATINTAFSSLSGSTLVKALKQLKPSGSASAAAASGGAASASTGAGNTIANRLSVARRQNKNSWETGMAAGDPMMQDLSVWAQPFVNHVHQGTKSGFDGYGADTYGFLIGGDALVKDGLRAGVAFGYSQTDVDGKGSSSGNVTEIDGYQGLLYGSYTHNNLFVDGLVGVGFNDFDQKRQINFLGATAEADYDGWQYSARLGTGVNLKTNGFEITPNAFIHYVNVDNDGYRETGAGAVGLSVESTDSQNTTTGIGVKVAYPVDTEEGRIIPEVRVNYLHEYGDDAQTTTSTFTGGGSSFSTTGPDYDDSSYNVGAGVRFYDYENIRVSGDVDYTKKDTSHAVSGMVKFKLKF